MYYMDRGFALRLVANASFRREYFPSTRLYLPSNRAPLHCNGSVQSALDPWEEALDLGR